MKNKFTIDPECSTRIKYNSLVIDVTHFDVDKEEAEEITRQIAQTPILSDSDKQFLKEAFHSYVAQYCIDNIIVEHPEKFGEISEKLGLDDKFVGLMKGVV